MTKSELLALHPWPADLAGARKLEWLWTFDLPVAPALLWPFIADTSRLNRALGFGETKFAERAGKRWGAARLGGAMHEWWEVPWEWVANAWVTRTRRYTRGYPSAMYAIHRIDPVELVAGGPGAPGSRLYLYVGFVARNALTAPLIRLGVPRVGRAYHRVLPTLARQIVDGRAGMPASLSEPTQLPELVQARIWVLQQKLVQLGLHEGAIAALVDWIKTADDQDIYRIQVRERAAAFGVDERAMLAIALHATRLGLLTLSWDIICPHCRGVREELTQLDGITASASCEVCEIEFTTDGAEAVEITFHVHPSIREVPAQLFCSAEPGKKAHIRVQRTVAPGARLDDTIALPAGTYRLRRVGDRTASAVVDITAAEAIDALPRAAQVIRLDEPPQGRLSMPSVARVIWENADTVPHQLVVEKPTWSDFALRPGQLLSFQEFRDLFSDQHLGDGIRLAVGAQTILFTDVVGSTALYAQVGDPDAFVAIKRHFDDVFAIVATHRGAVIKTIGDAVMAAFGEPLDAVKAAQAMHDAFGPTRTDSPIRLRVSLNTGSCLAVKLAANADYFGGTVNIAAKLQAHAETWQVAIGASTYSSPGVAAYLAASPGSILEQEFRPKAFTAGIPVFQWTVYPGP